MPYLQTYSNNSIFSPQYAFVRQILDDPLQPNLPTLNPLLICGLFVAVKRKKYREKALILLSRLSQFHGQTAMVDILKAPETRSYAISSLDISIKTRKEIVAYLLEHLTDPHLHRGILLVQGFYLTPQVLGLLRRYAQSQDEWIRKEALYAIEFIRKQQYSASEKECKS